MSKGLLSSGCNVTIIGRSEKRVLEKANVLNDMFDSSCMGLACDISNENSISEMIDQISALYEGKLSIAINSAGFNIRNRIENISLNEWESIQKN